MECERKLNRVGRLADTGAERQRGVHTAIPGLTNVIKTHWFELKLFDLHYCSIEGKIPLSFLGEVTVKQN